MAYSIRLPKVGYARASFGAEISTADMGYEEVMYCPETMEYKTVTQEREIIKLRKELEEKKVDRRKSLDNIISYFYKK